MHFVGYSYIYEVHMSSALNVDSAIWHFKHSDAIKQDNLRFLHGTVTCILYLVCNTVCFVNVILVIGIYLTVKLRCGAVMCGSSFCHMKYLLSVSS